MEYVHRMAPFLDSHLLLQCVLPFFSSEDQEFRKLKLRILQNTYRFEEAREYAKAIKIPENLLAGFEQHIKLREQDITHHKEKAEKLLKICENQDLCKELRDQGIFNLSYLKENFQIKPEDVKSLQTYAKDLYERGDYSTSEKLLHDVRAISQDADANNSALWGKLACHIILKRRSEALECLVKLKDRVESAPSSKTSKSAIQLANTRAWLLHWAVFFMFDETQTADDRSNPLHQKLQALLLEPSYLSTMQIVAPHLLRYLVAVLALNGELNLLSGRTILPILQNNQEKLASDPLFKVVDLIFNELDFEEAFRVLHEEIPKVCAQDPILNGFSASLKDSMEREIILVYCRVYNSIPIKEISVMAKKKDLEQTQIWLMNILQSNVIRARVDSESATIHIERESNDIFSQIYELAREDTFKINVLIEAFRKAKQYKMAAMKAHHKH